MPPGIVMSEHGVLTGLPQSTYSIAGVANNVKQDITSTFCCRATNTLTKQITDRTFSITVTGEDPPEIITRDGQLGAFVSGDAVSIQLEAIDLDEEAITWKITSGQLPPGLTLDSSTGLISGHPYISLDVQTANSIGWSADSGWEEYPWDFSVYSPSTSFQFEVHATDGKTTDGARYSIFIYSSQSLTADNSVLLSDHDDVVTSDRSNKTNPYLITPSSDLGVYVHDNYFAHQFKAYDIDGDELEYGILTSEGSGYDNELSGFDSLLFDVGEMALPPGLTINQETGWMYGQIPRQNAGQIEYTFAVRVQKKNYPEYKSGLTYFTITIINDLRFLVTWNTSNNLGTIHSGEISEKYVLASNEINRSLHYKIVGGRLPQGLSLLDDGLIVGRPSFETSSFDNGTTTFDKTTRGVLNETTIDKIYTFVVRAYDTNEEMVSTKTFNITVLPSEIGPYESLYVRVQSGVSDKEVINQVFRNTDVIPVDTIYRNSDPNFGRSKDARMLVVTGLTASSGSEYVQAMATNHYRKSLRLGKYAYARALNDAGEHIYDVVYIPVIDDLSVGNTKTVPKLIDLTDKITHDVTVDSSSLDMSSSISGVDGRTDKQVYPNSILNMRAVLKEKIGGLLIEPLPKWMTSKQSDGRIPGWTPVIVIAYVLPGYGAKTVFSLNRITKVDIKDVSFDVDRFIWDCNLSKNYNTVTNTFENSDAVTFDAFDDPNVVLVYTYSGDGSTAVYELPSDINVTPENTVISLETPTATGNILAGDVSVQTYNTDYTIADSTITFISAPLSGQNVIIKVSKTVTYHADFAVSVPFEELDGRSSEYINSKFGGLDGIVASYIGKRIIFTKQEHFTGYDLENNGWTRYTALWGDTLGWDDPDLPWDEYSIIPTTDRSGVWEFIQGSNGELRLQLVHTVALGNLVTIGYGFKYGGLTLRYGPGIDFSETDTVPKYHIFKEGTRTVETTFDERGTRFIDSVSIYQDPDDGDKYLAFPRVNIWA